MSRMTLAVLAVAALTGTAAWAAESTTTTTTTRDAPSTSVTVEQSGSAHVEDETGSVAGSTNCRSKTVKSENDMGEKKTVHKEKCD